jgi:cytochrome c-type biogenesis protein CcmH/NrfF
LLFAGKSKDRSKTLIFAVVPIVAIILGLVFLFIYLKRRRKKKTLKENAESKFLELIEITNDAKPYSSTLL